MPMAGPWIARSAVGMLEIVPDVVGWPRIHVRFFLAEAVTNDPELSE